MSIEDNARRVLLALASFGQRPDDPERGQHALEGEELEQVTGLGGSSLQDAVDVLDDRKHIERHRFVDDSVGQVRLNARGRLEAEKLSRGFANRNTLPGVTPPATTLTLRREILEELYKLNLDSPQATGMWAAERDNPLSAARTREAAYLKERGLVSGTIGGHGDLALRLTADGRDYVEAGGFWSKESSKKKEDESDPLPTEAETKLPRMDVTYGQRLGSGAFGTVWHATDDLLERDIAVKFLTSTDQAMDEDALLQEARSLAKLTHPNLVTVHAAAWLRHPETRLVAPAITMELLRGDTLEKWWSREHSRDEVLRVASGLVAGLLAMHTAGLVHGDLHEGNVMVLEDSTAKLIDWRYNGTLLQRSSSHRRNEIAAEQRRAFDRVDTLLEKQGLDNERAAIRGKTELAALAATIEGLRTDRFSANPPGAKAPGLVEPQRSKFAEMYSRFLEEANAYARAIEDYWTWMREMAFRPDRPTRRSKQKLVKDARDAMERALQPILLSDADETRGTLRWELLRGRGLEPIIDTTDNQKAYAVVNHYHHIRLLDGINRLQANVRETLGLPTRSPGDREIEFQDQMFERAKAEAEAVEANIKAQYETLMRTRGAEKANAGDSGSPVNAPIPQPLVPNTTESAIRNQVWNVLHVEIFEDDAEDVHTDRRGTITLLFVREIWSDVLARPVDEVPNDFVAAWQLFRELLMTCAESTFYGIVQQAGRVEDIREKLDDALERSAAPYRFSGEKLLPTPSAIEGGPIDASDNR